ncbi:SOS response-associated peptidase [Modestobacter sp. I12A-02628]|uniref:Abasic site processing protein n=1 Tax=Goekera deserti TaxID=2497753 RepID=A0A7K3W817_9ACTN|nr:SOS response-associated peptidase [Goekera deserti]MPQ99888.1 SOS response-associated peptidase [Goekera deserti]NDI50047.1 SOS response-associated peptidase [Goekera deserti]NEL52476.1 SOS response-associated peptidase [Goekera deserti]
MCGRYAASRRPEDLALEFEAVPAPGQPALPADYNVAPTKDVHVVRHARERDAEGRPTGGGHRELRVVRWGLVPSWAKDPSVGSRMLNARVESLTEKPAFRKAAATRRCLVPADGWYEWSPRTDGPGKQPWYTTPADGSVLAFAGLWEVWGTGEDRLYTCTVVTAPAVGALAAVHDRMPLVLPPDRWADWVDPELTDVAALTAPTPAELVESLEIRPVGAAVGKVSNNGPELTERVADVSAPADQPALF